MLNTPMIPKAGQTEFHERKAMEALARGIVGIMLILLISSSIAVTLSATDTVQMSDSVARTLTATRTVADTASMTDSVSVCVTRGSTGITECHS